MESDLPPPIDDSLPYEQPENDYQEQVRYYETQQPRYYTPPPPTPIIQPQQQTLKKNDIFSELDRTHWVIIISAVLLAFFMGKSIATPIIIRSVT